MLLTVKNPVANIYKKNNKNSEIVTQILFGENFITNSKSGKFYRGYKAYDKYKGFIETKDLYIDKIKKTHKIISKDCPLYKKHNFIQTKIGWILKKNVRPLNFKSSHFLDNVKLFLNTKYLWGGNSPKGLDCSALVQELLKFNNIYCPRDSKDQKNFFKKKISINNIKKGDLLFWKGHVAIALNNKKLVHAFGAKKKVVIMGIEETIKRIYSKSKLPLLCVKRIKKL